MHFTGILQLYKDLRDSLPKNRKWG